MEHQDWDTIYVRADKVINQSKKEKDSGQKEKKINTHQINIKKIEQKIEQGDLKHDKISPNLGKIIQQKRLEKNMTQKDLAQKINQPVKIINEIESGKANKNPQVVSKIKQIFNISKNIK